MNIFKEKATKELMQVTGRSYPTVYSYKRGQNIPINILQKLAKHYNIPIEALCEQHAALNVPTPAPVEVVQPATTLEALKATLTLKEKEIEQLRAQNKTLERALNQRYSEVNTCKAQLNKIKNYANAL